MTLTIETSSVTHVGNGVTTEWPFTFLIPDAEALRVTIYDTVLETSTDIDPADFSVTGLGDPNGGEVVYSPVATGEKITIWRDVAYHQETALTNQSPYYAEVLETQLDTIVMQTQQLNERLDRAVTVPIGSGLNPEELIDLILDSAAAAELAEANAEIAEANAEAAAAAAAASAALIAFPLTYAPWVYTLAEQAQARDNISAASTSSIQDIDSAYVLRAAGVMPGFYRMNADIPRAGTLVKMTGKAFAADSSAFANLSVQVNGAEVASSVVYLNDPANITGIDFPVSPGDELTVEITDVIGTITEISVTAIMVAAQ